MVKNWSLRIVLGVFCITGYTRLGSAHTTDLTHNPYRPHPKTLPASPHPLPASPPTPLQGERGVKCFAYCTLVTGWLVIYQPHPSHYQPPPNPSPRGEGSDMLCLLHACYLSTGQLPNHSSTSQSLVFLLTWHLANYPFVHFSAIFLTRRVPFLSTNCSPCRKNSILAEVCFRAKRG